MLLLMISILRFQFMLNFISQQKLSGQLTANTEKRLAARAGHLELLAGGKRDSKKSATTKEEPKKP
jgi:hypothetical protein